MTAGSAGGSKRVVVTGATGLLGGWVVEAARQRGHEVVGLSRTPPEDSALLAVDLLDPEDVRWAFDAVRPDVVVHCAAISAMDACAREPDEAARVNGELPGVLAEATHARGAFFVHVSTDLVFDGEHAPYAEDAAPSAGSVYGRTKAAAEARVLAAGGLVARTSLLFGPTRTARRGFFDGMVAALREGRELRLFDDEWRTAAPLDWTAHALVRLAEAGEGGVVHLAGERLSRAEMGEALARALGVASPRIARAQRASAGGEPRPRDVSLGTGATLPRLGELAPGSFEDACRRMLG